MLGFTIISDQEFQKYKDAKYYLKVVHVIVHEPSLFGINKCLKHCIALITTIVGQGVFQANLMDIYLATLPSYYLTEKDTNDKYLHCIMTISNILNIALGYLSPTG